jgi:hypothetical protein
MDEFAKYHEMCAAGASPEQIYSSAKADGVGPIAVIRLLRTVSGLSLAQAKGVIMTPDPFDAKQEAKVGSDVYWETWDSVDGFHLMQARVARIADEQAHLEGHRKFRLTPDGWEEVPLRENGLTTIPLRYFDKTLAERIGDGMAFLEGVACRKPEPVEAGSEA